MCRPQSLATPVLAALTILALAGWLSVRHGRTVLGQQDEGVADLEASTTRTTPIGGVRDSKFTLEGHLHVKYHLPEGPADPSPQKVIEDVRRIIFFDEWVLLRVKEGEETATLVIPRDKLIYLKAWDIKEEE